MSDFAIDPAHFDALFVQSETPGLPAEEKNAYLAGIGACWPAIRARLWELSIRVAADQEKQPYQHSERLSVRETEEEK